MSRLTDFDNLPLREKQELAFTLRTGIASPFWTEYRAWLAELFQDHIRTLVISCTDIPSILAAEKVKGVVAGLDQAMHSPEVFLAQLDELIAAETADEEIDNGRSFQSFPDSP